jgi:flagellar protein FlaI
MNVAKIYVPLINIAAMVERVQLPSAKGNMTFGRRLTSISEVIDYGEYRTVGKWDPVNDTFKTSFEESEQLQKIGTRLGLTKKDIISEVSHRALLLHDLREKGIRKNVELSKFITNYYIEGQAAKIQKTNLKGGAK